MSTIKIVDVSTNEIIEREMTEEENKDIANRKLMVANEKSQAEAAATAKAALLEKLGITEEEARLLLS
jgi:hypothetical protein